MELRQLRYFIAVAEELSFSKAAPRVFATQSTVSASIASLEEELGVQLLLRSTRSVSLSEAGFAFLEEARAVLNAVARAQDAATKAAQGLRGVVRIGTLNSATALDLPALIGAFRTRYPNVEVHVQVSASGSLGIAEELIKGRLDLGLVAMSPRDVPELTLRPVASVPYVAVLPRGHRLASRKRLELSDLHAEPFVDGAPGFYSRKVLDAAFASLGLERRILVEVADIQMVPAYVVAIGGVAVVPNFRPFDASVPIKMVPVKEFAEPFVLSLATRAKAPLSPAVECLLAASTEHVKRGEMF